MESLFAMTWTIPELDRIIVIFDKKLPKFTENYRYMNLVRIQWWIKNSLSNMNRICDDNDSTGIGKTSSLVNTTSYCKELCFSIYDIYGIMNYFDN